MHKIYARHTRTTMPDRLPIPLIKRSIKETLALEGVDAPCEVSVLITDDLGIKKINSDFRGIDRPTDVLSFPMLDFSAPGWKNAKGAAADPETSLLPLGEIVFSGERVHWQASAYGKSCEHETAYLTVHSVLHLLGYDHADESDRKKQMRGREKIIMKKMGF